MLWQYPSLIRLKLSTSHLLPDNKRSTPVHLRTLTRCGLWTQSRYMATRTTDARTPMNESVKKNWVATKNAGRKGRKSRFGAYFNKYFGSYVVQGNFWSPHSPLWRGWRSSGSRRSNGCAGNRCSLEVTWNKNCYCNNLITIYTKIRLTYLLYSLRTIQISTHRALTIGGAWQ